MRLGVTLAALLVASLAAAQGPDGDADWTQVGGDARRSGVVSLATEAPLDIVATYDLLPGGEFFYGSTTGGMVTTPRGLVGMAFDPEDPAAPECRMFRVVDPYVGTTADIGAPFPCPGGGRISGYSPTQDILLACIDGLPLSGDDLLFSFSGATGSPGWSTRPDISAAEVPGAGDSNDWFCEGVAIDDAGGVAYVGYSSDMGRNRVEAVRLSDGVRLWSTPIALRNHIFGANDRPLENLAPTRSGDSDFTIDGVTFAGTGIVVRGSVRMAPDVPLAAQFGPAPAVFTSAAWLSTDGVLAGAHVPTSGSTEKDAQGGALGGSVLASSARSLAVAVFQTGLVFIEPQAGDERVVPFPEWEPVRNVRTAIPAWSETHLVVPLPSTVEILDAADLTASRTWSGQQTGGVWNVVIAGPRDAYVQVLRTTETGAEMDVIRVDLGTARTVQVLSIAMDEQPVGFLVPIPDGRGMLASGVQGTTAVLAPAPPERIPAAVVDEDYPAIGEGVRLDLPPAARGELGYLVAWGDGVVEPAAAGDALVHAYTEEVRRTLRVTALYSGNLTATQEITVHVGEPRPLELNFMQRAFAPENEEKTYAIVGIAATALGGVIALVGRTRRKGRLAAEIEALDRIRARGRVDPHDAVHALAEYRRALRAELASGKVDDVQFSVLDHSAFEVLHALRQRVLGPLAGRVGSEFAHRLDLALADGTIDPQEAATLGEMIAREASLSPGERAQLLALCRGFPAADGSTAPERTAQGP